MKVLYSFFLLCLLTINTVCAQGDEIDAKCYILCINSYTDASPLEQPGNFMYDGICAERP